MGELCGVRHFTAAAAGSCVFALGLSAFFFACCITVWALPSHVAGDFISRVTRQAVSDQTVNTLAVGTIIELLNIIAASVALNGIHYNKAGMVLVYVVYLPLYTIYQMAVLVLMILYLINKSSDIVNSSQENPNSTEVDHMLYNILPFVPILCFWTITITINVGGSVISGFCYRQVRKIQREPDFNLITGSVYLGNQTAALNAKANGFTHVLNCADELDVAVADNGIVYKKLPLAEDIGNFIRPDFIAEGVDWLRTVNRPTNKVLVSCHMGISRSASIVIAYIFAENPQLSYDDVVDNVMERRYVVPHIGLEETLYAMYPRRRVA